jgi:hypothetical protein
MVAIRKIEAFDDAQLDHEVESPEEGGPAHPDSPVARDGREVGRREVTVLVRDQLGQRESRRSQSVTRLVERTSDAIR